MLVIFLPIFEIKNPINPVADFHGFETSPTKKEKKSCIRFQFNLLLLAISIGIFSIPFALQAESYSSHRLDDGLYSQGGGRNNISAPRIQEFLNEKKVQLTIGSWIYILSLGFEVKKEEEPKINNLDMKLMVLLNLSYSG